MQKRFALFFAAHLAAILVWSRHQKRPSCIKQNGLFAIIFLFDAAIGKGLDEALLEHEEDHQQWRNREERGCAYIRPLRACFIRHGKDGQSHSQRALINGIDNNQRPKEIVPLI